MLGATGLLKMQWAVLEEEELRRRRRVAAAHLASVRELREERERQQSAMALQRQRELDEAGRISAKARRDVETAQKLKAEKEERLRAAEKLSAELLEQSKALALEWQRGSLVDRIQSIRPRPAATYGSWSTGDLEGLLASLNAARERLGQPRWSQLAGVR
jgi:predicted acyl esterase